MSISYGIVQEHGGQITAVSEEGKGTTFTVELPVTKDSNSEDGHALPRIEKNAGAERKNTERR